MYIKRLARDDGIWEGINFDENLIYLKLCTKLLQPIYGHLLKRINQDVNNICVTVMISNPANISSWQTFYNPAVNSFYLIKSNFSVAHIILLAIIIFSVWNVVRDLILHWWSRSFEFSTFQCFTLMVTSKVWIQNNFSKCVKLRLLEKQFDVPETGNKTPKWDLTYLIHPS